MTLSIQIPKASSSFRAEYSTRPVGFLTPPPPSLEIEPFSPTESYSPHTGSYWTDSRKRRFQEADLLNGSNNTKSTKRPALQQQESAWSTTPRFHNNNPHTHQTAPSPSALEVFAAVATSPELAQGAFNPHIFTTPWLNSRPEASYHGKRSRSEIVDARTAFDSVSRPATSHVSNPHLSFTSAHIDSWQDQRNRDSSYLHHHSTQRPNGGPLEDNMQDAELLLSFALGAKYNPRVKAVSQSSFMREDGPSQFRGHHQYSHSTPHDHSDNQHLQKAERCMSPTFGHASNFEPVNEDSCRDDGQQPRDLTASVQADGQHHLPAVEHQFQQTMSDNIPLARHVDPHDFTNGNGADDHIIDEMKQESNGHVHDSHSLPSLPKTLSPDAVPDHVDTSKPKMKTKGWPKGKPRGKKSTASPVKQTHKSKKQASRIPGKSKPLQGLLTNGHAPSHYRPPRPDFENTFRNRARTFSESHLSLRHWSPLPSHRHSSLPVPETSNDFHADLVDGARASDEQGRSFEHDMQSNICTVCQSQSATSGYQDQWIKCNGCKNNWFHTACVGLKNEREVRDIDKFYCNLCEVNGLKTTRVRKSKRAHASLDYAGLNQGEVRTATDTVDHHYIRAFKEGTISLTPETFPRMRPEMVTAEFFERSGTMSEPILIPAAWNPRPSGPPTKNGTTPVGSDDTSAVDGGASPDDLFQNIFNYDCMPDDGQDKLDMVMPTGLTVRAVSEIIGPEEKVEVIDVKSQEGGDGRWNLRKWADYYEASGEKPVRNVISLEVSQTKLGRLIRRPKLVRDLDLQDAVWPQDELAKGAYPQVQFYCLMSVQDCYTDFHIDFGGSSVYYHIMKGSKTFFFIPPKKQHLKAYEQWCKSSNQSAEFLGDITKECYRVDLSEGDTMLIPSGWIHAVWTPTNSLVIGGNFLTRMHYGMQIAINDIEKATGVTRKFRYPSFQKVLWYTVIQYLQDDPVPSTVAQTLYAGQAFERQNPTWDDFEPSDSDDFAYCHARYYSKGEIDGLVDLMRYVHRTVMISLGKVQGVSKTTTEAVIRSLPKGYGDHLDLLKTFALWCAWKRGNEILDPWAHPDFPVSALEPVLIEKKPEKMTAKLQGERRSARAIKEKEEKPLVKAPEVESANKSPVTHTTKSAPGPRRIACEACRKRRIRCKHKDSDDTQPNASPVQRFGIKSIRQPSPDPSTLDYTSASPWAPVAVMIPQDVAPTAPISSQNLALQQQNVASSKVKACDECRKSKRRCVHDEFGNVDPIKASQTPVPRAYSASKRARPESDTGQQSIKRIKHEGHNANDQFQNSFSSDDDQDGYFHAPETNAPHLAATTIADHLLDPSLMDVDDQNCAAGFASPANFFDCSAIEQDFRPTAFPPTDLQGHFVSYTDDSFSLEADEEVAAILPHVALASSALEGLKDHKLTRVPSVDPPFPDVEEHSPGPGADPTAEDGPINGRRSPHGAPPGNVAPSRAVSPADRSRTPSLRVQTNSSESNAASASIPSSPLTELEPSSPVAPQKSVEHPSHIPNRISELVIETAWQANSALPSNTNAFTTPKVTRKTSHRTSISSAPIDSRSSKKTPAGNSKKQSVPRNSTTGSSTSPIETAGSPVSSSPEEDASMKLIRQMQEQEFGLRRRS